MAGVRTEQDRRALAAGALHGPPPQAFPFTLRTLAALLRRFRP